MPAATGIAILRYRLWDIDRLISRTIAYTIVTGVLALTFVATILGLQAALASFTRDQTLVVAASTLVAAALFQPLRGRVQRAVDLRFDRARVNGERTSAAFADRIRDTVEIHAVATELAATVDYLFGFDATAGVVTDWMYAQLAENYVLDKDNQDFMKHANPWALRGIIEKLSEAIDRGLSQEPDPELITQLQQIYLAVEGDLEDI